MNETCKIEDLIEGLPNNFPEATEMLRTEIIPLMVGMEKALTMHYVIKISEKTQATVFALKLFQLLVCRNHFGR